MRRAESGNNNNQNNNNNNNQNKGVSSNGMRRMKEKATGCPTTPAPWTCAKGKTPVRLSNNNGSSHKGESHGREEDYGPVLSRKNSLKTASMGESELQSEEDVESDDIGDIDEKVRFQVLQEARNRGRERRTTQGGKRGEKISR